MLLSVLELVDIGADRVLIVPNLEPSELTMEMLGVLTLEDAEEFWGMVHRSRTSADRDTWSLKLHSPFARLTSTPARRRRVDSPMRLPAIPEVPRAESAGAEGLLLPGRACSHDDTSPQELFPTSRPCCVGTAN
jgi:hypothetical protein